MSKWRDAVEALTDVIAEHQFTAVVQADYRDTGEPMFILIGCHPNNEDEAFVRLVMGAKSVAREATDE